jgi:hypothetical protein
MPPEKALPRIARINTDMKGREFFFLDGFGRPSGAIRAIRGVPYN